jgi:hypothetical protein
MPPRDLAARELAALASELIRQANATSAKHLTPEALSERLDVPVATLRDWRNQGRGPAYIRGESDGDKATIRYPLAWVEEWELSRRVEPATA